MSNHWREPIKDYPDEHGYWLVSNDDDDELPYASEPGDLGDDLSGARGIINAIVGVLLLAAVIVVIIFGVGLVL